MGASASTISVTDFSEAKAIYESKKAEGLSDEDLFAQIKAAIDAKHHTPAVVDEHGHAHTDDHVHADDAHAAEPDHA